MGGTSARLRGRICQPAGRRSAAFGGLFTRSCLAKRAGVRGIAAFHSVVSARRRFHPCGRTAEAPLVTLRFERPLSIMKHQVSASDYQRCVDAGSCRPLETGVVIAADRPAVRVSWARRRQLRRLAVAQHRLALSAADRRGMGVRGGQPICRRRIRARRQRSLQGLDRPLRARIRTTPR